MADPVPTVADLVGLALDEMEGPVGPTAATTFEVLREELEDDLPAGLPEGRARRVLQILTEILSIPVPEIVVGGWRKYAELLDLSDPDRYPPGTVHEVPLVEHTVRTEWEPGIDVLVNGRPVTTLAFQVELEIALDGAVAVVRDGRITALSPGRWTSTGRVRFRGRTLAERSAPSLEMPGLVRLGDGIPLRPGPPAPSGSTHAPR
jgi:hypothetical protein